MLQVEDSQLQALAQLTRASFAQVMALQSDLGWDTWGAVAIQPA
jgi:hypothetical protein